MRFSSPIRSGSYSGAAIVLVFLLTMPEANELAGLVLQGQDPLQKTKVITVAQATGSLDNQTSDRSVFSPANITTIIDTATLAHISKFITLNKNYSGLYITAQVYDWSKDGKSILFGYNNYELGCMDLNMPNSLATFDLATGTLKILNINNTASSDVFLPSGRYVREDCPQGVHLEIYQAKFSPSGDAVYYLLGGRDNSNVFRFPDVLYKYELSTGVSQQLINESHITWFDVGKDNSDQAVAYATGNSSFHFYPHDNQTLVSRLHNISINAGFPIDWNVGFHVSPDSKHFIFYDTYGYHLIIVNANSGVFKVFGNAKSSCFGSATFSPNGQYIIYSEYGGRNCPQGQSYVLHIVSADGSLDEIVYRNAACCVDAVVSPDGAYLATVAEGSTAHLWPPGPSEIKPRIVTIQLAKTVSEFDSGLPMLVGALFISSAILIAKSRLGTRLR